MCRWLGVMAGFLIGPGLTAGDWPQFRGPTHDGHATELEVVTEWPAAGPPLLWSREIGAGYSGFAMVGDRAFTLAQSVHQQFVLCLDANNGETVWTTAFGQPFEGGLYPGPRATPSVVGDRVVFASPEGEIGCLRVDDGSWVWRENVQRRFRGKGTDFGYSASPLVVDGLVIVPVGGDGASVVALKVEDGSIAWQSGDQPASYSTPIPIEWRGHKLVVALLENTLAAFDRQTGELWWELELSRGYDEHSAAPLYREPYLLISAPFKAGARVFELVEAADKNRCRPQRVWEHFQFSNDVASSVLVGDLVFGFDLKEAQSRRNRPSRGEFRCLDLLTGTLRWSAANVGQVNPIVVGDKLLMFNDAGELILARATGESYQELARASVFPGEVTWTLPSLSNGRLLLRSQNRVACLLVGPRSAEQSVAHPLRSVRDIPAHRPFDPTWLIGGEREFPAMTPEWRELRAWFGWSLAVMATSWLLAIGVRWCLQKCVRSSRSTQPDESWGMFSTCPLPDRGRFQTVYDVVFWFGVIGLAAIGSPVLNAKQSTYLFLWPLIVWSGLQLAALASQTTRGSRFFSRVRVMSYAVGLTFFGVCGVYYHLCRWLGLATEWSFLVGLLPGFPIAVFAARAWFKSRHRLTIAQSAWLTTSFAAYFWSSAAFAKWWLSVGT